MTSAARIVFVSCGNYVVAMPIPVLYSLYTFHDDVVYATIRFGASLLLFYETAKHRRHSSDMTRCGGHVPVVSPRSNSDVHEQEACPASRMLDFDRFCPVFVSILAVELTTYWEDDSGTAAQLPSFALSVLLARVRMG